MPLCTWSWVLVGLGGRACARARVYLGKKRHGAQGQTAVSEGWGAELEGESGAMLEDWDSMHVEDDLTVKNTYRKEVLFGG
jgi:hypothetical protein